MKSSLLYPVLLISLLTTGCVSNQASQSFTHLTNKTWVLTHIYEQPLNNTLTDFPTIQLDAQNKQFHGTDGCNRIIGIYESRIPNITFFDITGTKMACIEQKQQRAINYTTALAAIRQYRVDSKYLVLQNQYGQTLLRFAHVPQTR